MAADKNYGFCLLCRPNGAGGTREAQKREAKKEREAKKQKLMAQLPPAERTKKNKMSLRRPASTAKTASSANAVEPSASAGRR